MNTTASAPGKLVLMGEHAVVYGHPAIVTAVGQRCIVSVEQSGGDNVVFDVPEGMDTRFVSQAVHVLERRWKVNLAGLTIHTTAGFSSTYGFGSSSAVVVAVITVIASYIQKKVSPKELFDRSYETVLAVQGKGSGIDVAAAIYGGTLYFVTGGKIIEPLAAKDMPLIIGYTGVKVDTTVLINEVAEKMKTQTERVNRAYDAIAKLVEDAKIKILEGDWERVGKLMDFNQEYLRDLGVSSEKLESLISAAKGAGAWGAKLSGAGGGDCMICLAPSDKREAISKAIEKVGGQVIHFDQVGAEGVRIEL